MNNSISTILIDQHSMVEKIIETPIAIINDPEQLRDFINSTVQKPQWWELYDVDETWLSSSEL